MKKTLMVLGLATCATMAFAQTNVDSRNGIQCQNNAIVERIDAAAVDYKASIFTKAEGDTVSLWDFDETTGMTYGLNGRITAATNIYVMNADSNYRWISTAFQPHTFNTESSVFMLMPDTNYLNTHSSTYSNPYGWPMSAFTRNIAAAGIEENFMFLLPMCQTPASSDRHDAYIQFPQITNPNVGATYEVRLTQIYRKFLDDCYVDYKVGNDWYTREINITGVDCQVNGWGADQQGWVMPRNFGDQSDITIRIRFYNDYVPTTMNQVYGYMWGVDNVAIVEVGDGWITAGTPKFVDGSYAMIPEGFNVPLAWYAQIYNNSANDLATVNTTLYHIDDQSNAATAVTSNVTENVVANPLQAAYITLNERGWLDTAEWGGWFGYSSYYNNNAMYDEDSEHPYPSIPARYTRHGLPTDNPGVNRFTITASTAGLDDLTFDTMAYNVVLPTGGDANLSVQGYRLAHDNGIITSNSKYTYGVTVSEGTSYLTTEGGYNRAGYMVWVRFTTPDVIPTDENGEPWVIRGLEIVPQTDTTVNVIENSVIQPMLYNARYFDSSDGNNYMTYERISGTGLSEDYTYTVTANDVNTSLNNQRAGVIAPNDDYKAVNFHFLGQPTLKPNTSVYAGYRLTQNGYFAAARHLYGYTDASTGDVVRYNNDPDLAAYYHQMVPSYGDVRIVDPGDNRTRLVGNNHEYWPLIRLIVGPREEIPNHYITATCSNENYEILDETAQYNVCGEQVSAPEGGDYTMYIVPTGDRNTEHPGIIDTIIIDGRPYDVNDILDINSNAFQITERNYDIYNADSSQVLLNRSYFIVTFTGLTMDHEVSAKAHAYEWVLGIDRVAANVALSMQPNPATSSVTLNMSGVSGMVECSIIDMSGRVVYNSNMNSEVSNTIDLSNIAAGAYFVRVTNDKFSKVEKLIVR